MRVAYFPDSFHEINGVAHTSRQFEAFAQRRDLPFLSVRAGDRSQPYVSSSRVASLELKRGFFSFALEKDLRIDLGFLRHLPLITRTVREFKPDVIHITGPSELGFIGAFLACGCVSRSWPPGTPMCTNTRPSGPHGFSGSCPWANRRPPRCTSSRSPSRRRPVLQKGAGPLRPQCRTMQAVGTQNRPAMPPDAPRRRHRALFAGAPRQEGG